jgi:hypothetical protein
MFSRPPIRSALRSTFVTFAASAFFSSAGERQREVFRMNPANTTTFQALKALEDHAIIDLAELLKKPPIDAHIRGREKLAIHRDMICHPAVPLWRRQDRQDFADAGHRHSHVRIGLIWDVRKSINDALTAVGRTDLIEGVVADWEMASMLRLILEHSAAPGLTVHSTEDLLKYLQGQSEKFGTALDDYPDGIVEKDEESDETSQEIDAR